MILPIMKIPRELPQFRNKALIIVAGNLEAEFYLCFEGVINSIDSFKIPMPKYAKEGGYFMTRGTGKVFRTGAVYEKSEQIRHRFKIRFKEAVKKNNFEDFSEIYVFTPSGIKKDIEESLSLFKGKIQHIFAGDYTHGHQFDLLKKIKEEVVGERIVKLIKEEAFKILNK